MMNMFLILNIVKYSSCDSSNNNFGRLVRKKVKILCKWDGYHTSMWLAVEVAKPYANEV